MAENKDKVKEEVKEVVDTKVDPEMEEMRALFHAMKESGITADNIKAMLAKPEAVQDSGEAEKTLSATKRKKLEKLWDAAYKAVHPQFKDYILTLKQRDFTQVPQLNVVTIDNLNGDDTQFIGSAGYTVRVPKQVPVCMPVNFANELRKAAKPYKDKEYMKRMTKESKQARRKAAFSLRIHVTPKVI